MAATVASVMNVKNGVGKTTMAFNLACYSVMKEGLKVLVVDLDPQAKLTQHFIPEIVCLHLLEDEDNLSICDIFEKNRWSHNIILNHEIGIYEPKIDLILSRMDLVSTIKNPINKERRLARFLSEIKNEYDLILLDCPPNESVLTTASYLASDYIIIASTQDRMEANGLKLMAESIRDFNHEYKGEHEVKVAGVIINQVKKENLFENARSKMPEDWFMVNCGWPVFDSQISYSEFYAKGKRDRTPIFKTQNARQNEKMEMLSLGLEFLQTIEI